MRRHENSVLGIDLNEREIRVAHVGVKGGRSFVIATAAAPLPNGAMANGFVMEFATLSLALRRLLDSMGSTGSAKAVFGISGDQTSFRGLSIPPCPDSELPALVEGEMRHQGVWREDGSPHDFFSLHPSTTNEDMRSVAIVGVDVAVTQGLCEVAEGIGVGIAALEPMPLAMLRTATATLPPAATAFLLIVGNATTDAAFFVEGRLATYRRLEVGTDAIVQPMPIATHMEDPTSLSGGAPLPPLGIGGESDPLDYAGEWSPYDHSAVDRLAIEVQRTLDYVQRFDRSGTKIGEVGIVTVDPEVEPLAPMLERRLGLPVALVALPSGVPDLRFAAAYGLAAHAFATPLETPRVDLFANQRDEAKREETKRNFKGSILVAAVGILVGVFGCVLYNRQIARIVAESKVATEQIADLKAKTNALLDLKSDEDARYLKLRKEGVPLGPVMDYVVTSLDPGVGLKSVALGEDLKVRIGGEARDESALVRTTQGLQTSPILSEVALDQFARATPETGGALTFQISGAAASIDRIRLTGGKS